MENKTFELLEKMYSEFSQRFESIENKVDRNHQSIENLDKRVSNLEQGQQDIKEHLLSIEAKNAERHIEIMSKLSQDIEFIKHKEFKNEEDIFNLKRNLEIAK